MKSLERRCSKTTIRGESRLSMIELTGMKKREITVIILLAALRNCFKRFVGGLKR